MCFSGICRYENYDGECSFSMRAVKPEDALCVQDYLDEEAEEEWKNSLEYKIKNEILVIVNNDDCYCSDCGKFCIPVFENNIYYSNCCEDIINNSNGNEWAPVFETLINFHAVKEK